MSDLEQEVKDTKEALQVSVDEVRYAQESLATSWVNYNTALKNLENFEKDLLADHNNPL